MNLSNAHSPGTRVDRYIAPPTHSCRHAPKLARVIQTFLWASVLAAFGLPSHLAIADSVSIEPAAGFPEYTKVAIDRETPDFLFWNHVAIGDFNGDGRLDVIAQTGTPPFPGDLPLAAIVYLQDAKGNFTHTSPFPLPNTSVGIRLVTGDFNEDGKPDVLGDDSGNDLFILTGKGDGTFAPARFLELSAAGLFAVADLNGDHHLDIVAANLDGSVGVFLGKGDGSFKSSATLDTIVQPYWIVRGNILVGDVNKDGKPDVAVASTLNSSTGTGNLDVFLGNGDGTFKPVVRTESIAALFSTLGDFNGDGITDYACTQFSNLTEVWLGKGDGHFTKGKSLSSGLGGMVQAADLNQDGILDLIVSGDNGTVYLPQAIFLGKGDGTFQSRISFSQINGYRNSTIGSQFVDLNNDGWIDLVGAAASGSNPYPSAIVVAYSHGPRKQPNSGAIITVKSSTPSPTTPAVIEASSDFIHWDTIATQPSLAAQWRVVDATTSLSQRFYRARRP